MKTYIPRPGSKIALAAEALKDGPKSTAELAIAMAVQEKVVFIVLTKPCTEDYLIRLQDKRGQMYWALDGTAIGQEFTPYQPSRKSLPETPAAHTITTIAEISEEARRFADPFGRTKGGVHGDGTLPCVVPHS